MERLTLKRKDGSYTFKESSTLPFAIAKLGRLEDAEEQGLLLRLPCKVGATVYWVSSWYCNGGKYKVTDETAESFMYEGEDIIVIMVGGKTGIFGYNVFLTKEEAEQALKQMGE